MEMKVGVIIFHKAIYAVYRQEWISKCIRSIHAQTFKYFKIYELNYGEMYEQLIPWSDYFHRPMDNHIFAMNFILDKAFEECDVVFNVNLDDYYDTNRFALQLEEVEKGADLVSSDFHLIEEHNGEDEFQKTMHMAGLDIQTEFNKGHNVLAHPVICYTKGFWERNKYYNTDELGYEDFTLWKKALAAKEKIVIIPQGLLYYRLSKNQVSRVHHPKGAF